MPFSLHLVSFLFCQTVGINEMQTAYTIIQQVKCHSCMPSCLCRQLVWKCHCRWTVVSMTSSHSRSQKELQMLQKFSARALCLSKTSYFIRKLFHRTWIDVFSKLSWQCQLSILHSCHSHAFAHRSGQFTGENCRLESCKSQWLFPLLAIRRWLTVKHEYFACI